MNTAVESGPRRRMVVASVATVLALSTVPMVLRATGAHGDPPVAAGCPQQLAAWRFTSSPPALGVIAGIDGGGTATTAPAFNDAAPPAWSRDGRLATYDGETGRFVIRDATGTVLTTFSEPVRPSPYPNAGPLAWSPDGTRLSYAGEQGLSVVAADGSGSPTLLYAAADITVLPGSGTRWSPDSTRLAWSDGASVRLARADGTGVSTLGPGAVDRQPSWAPDGSGLVWAAGGVLYAYRSTDGSVSQVAVAGYTQLDAPAYSPDGSRIGLLATAADGTRRLLSVEPTGGGGRDLTPASPPIPTLPVGVGIRWDVQGFAWSPDGTRLAWDLGLITENVLFGSSYVAGWTDAATGTVERMVFEGSSSWPLWLRWSPDGRWLAYSSDTQGFGVGTGQTMLSRVFASVVNLDGTVRREIPDSWYQPEWNPAPTGSCGGGATTTTSTVSTTPTTVAPTTTTRPPTSTTVQPGHGPGALVRWLLKLVCRLFRLC